MLMLDMEDHSFVQRTLDLHSLLLRENIPAAVTVQAYLYRSEQDIRQLIEKGATVRLVKGAFVGTRDYAWTKKADVTRNYIHLARMLLSPAAEARGVYPAFGTHDDRVISIIKETVREQGRAVSPFEFEMLYGVRPNLQKQLVDEGYRVRLYLPFGTDWWPYAIRRVGENPKNLKFVLRNLRF